MARPHLNMNVNKSEGCRVTFVSWNVKSLNHPVKRKKVISHLNQLNVGIAFLQETHLTTFDHFRLRRGWMGQFYHSNFHSKARGTAILINKNVPFVMSSVEADSAGRYIIVVGKLNNTPVILANLYAPNWDDSTFFTDFFSRLPNIDTHHLILGGDMNCVLSPTLDRSSPRATTSSKAAQAIKQFLNSYSMTDTWRFRNPTRKSYSFYSPVHKTYSRIDYFFLDNELLSLVRECEYQAIVISDHAPLLLTLCIPTTHTNYRPWRFNTLLLSDAGFIKFISNEITEYLARNQTPGMSSSVIWESMKAYLRGQIISYNAHTKKALKERLEKLTKDILQLDETLAHTPLPDLFKQRLTLQTEFNLLSTKHAENLINKSRHKTYEYGEKTGKILAHQLRQENASRTITAINNEMGVKLTDPLEINQCFHRYYSRLYTTESSNDETLFDSFFSSLNTPIIDEETATNLESPFSKEEFITATRSMQNGKSPGPDGYPSEFFKKFANELAPILLSVYEESFNSGSLPETMRQAVISLIHKKGKNILECSSFRPISLLNVDSKLLAKMLALRLENVLPSVVSDDQTGFIKNRQSFFNIRRLMNILYNPTPPDTAEVLLSLDAEKAFDRVEWDYLFYTLKKFGFGAKFTSWIHVLYSLPIAAVRTNNNLSSFFPLRRGTRQGCPLSPLLFALAIEPLAIALRGNISIKGIQRNNTEHKVSLYADDMLLYLSEPLSSLPLTLTLLDTFGKISGYKINTQKSELMPINPAAKQIVFSSLPFKISKNKFKYLGIWITHDFKHLYKANFLPLIESLKNDLERWNLLTLSLGGRINAIKMNVLPRFLYLFQCIPIFLTKSFFLLTDKLLSSFIWNKKIPRIQKTTLQRHRKYGGLSLPNFQYYYWSANIRAMLYWLNPSQDSSPKWLQLENLSCGPASLHALLCSKLPLPEPIIRYSVNPVIKHSLKIWAQFRRAFSLNNMLINAPISRNNMFKPSIIDGFFDIWTRNGLATLKDLYIDDNFASFEQLSLKYKIPNSHFFRYLQLRSFVSSQSAQFPSVPPSTLLDSLLKFSSNHKGLIGIIYLSLNSYNVKPLTRLKGQWEEELGVEFTEDIWDSILDKIHSSSICLRHEVMQFKIVHRLHWSKARLAKITPDIDPKCDRCGAATATLSHMFWFCPKLTDFWQTIFKFFSDLLGISIEPLPMIAIFGVVPRDICPTRHGKNMIAFAMLLARRLILLKWKDRSPPTFKQWIRDLLHHLTLEKIRYATRGCALNFYSIWQPVLDQLEKMDASDILSV